MFWGVGERVCFGVCVYFPIVFKDCGGIVFVSERTHVNIKG